MTDRPPPPFALLDRLRQRFLDSPAVGGDYWESTELLDAYDATLGERIGWKWDAVLAELRLRGWTPPAGAVLDWGCGSGIAGRRVVAAWGAGHFPALVVHDRSALAKRYAVTRAREQFPGLAVEPAADWGELAPAGPFTLVVSHVLNELAPADSAALLALARRAAAVLWVEPGTSEVARALVSLREELRTDARVVAPCTHQAACGLLAPENQRHWCHHFARPPTEAFTSPFWAEFGRRLGVDLRSLPYSFLVLDRSGRTGTAAAELPGVPARILGEPREYKGFARLLSCEEGGVTDRMLQKRDAPALFKLMKRVPAPPVFGWELREERIVAGHRLATPPVAGG